MSGLGYKKEAEKAEEEEEDYMSDAFLANCASKDVRPGLKMTHSKKREHEMMKRKQCLEDEERQKKRSKKSLKEMEVEKREEGMSKRLDSSNKGFAMLSKMGYKEGEGLGKKSGRVDPIPLEVKTDRGGLGREAVLREVRERKMQAIRRTMDRRRRDAANISTDEFRAHHSRQRRLNLCQSDLYKSQKACQQLDQDQGVAEPAEVWFWPKAPKTSEEEEEGGVPLQEEEEEEPELEADEQLSILTGYLRREYLYCLWCGCHFSDFEDMSANCPGDDREAHDD